MHSRYARKLYDPKMKRIFEITQVDLRKSYLSTIIHMNKHMEELEALNEKDHNGLLFTSSNEYI